MGEELTTKQRRAIVALLNGSTQTEAAEAAGVHPNRISEWMKLDTFITELRNQEAQVLQAVSRDLVRLGKKATGVMEEELDGYKPELRLKAANMVLAHLLRVRELAIEERLTALEAKLNHQWDNHAG